VLGSHTGTHFSTMSASATTEQKVERLKQDSDIQKALEQTASPATYQKPGSVPAKSKRRIYLGSYLLLLFVLSGLYYLLNLRLFSVAAAHVPFLQRLDLGAMAIITVLALAKATDFYVISRVEDVVSEYNIRRVLKLVAALLIAFIIVSLLFAGTPPGF
jgi:succinate dehydrogenase hydrophobic anchor subunit